MADGDGSQILPQYGETARETGRREGTKLRHVFARALLSRANFKFSPRQQTVYRLQQALLARAALVSCDPDRFRWWTRKWQRAEV
jgi:hypothetical protein